MQIKPSWIVFDVGRVLFHFDKFANDLIAEYLLEKEALLEQINNVSQNSFEGQLTLEEFWRNVLAAFQLENQVDSVITMWNTDETNWVADTKKLLGELKSVGYHIAILTNNWGNQTVHLRKNLSLYVPAEYIFESSVEKLSKPDRKFFQLVEKRINANGSDIFFIDDTKSYREGAEELGWQTFAYEIGNDLGETSNNALRNLLLIAEE